ncbi:hypothetical protein ACHQM5_006527 [Ranunculus cassubicifolius]
MEEDQEQKHVCKFCYKQFPCGRSLGGHMRSHMRNTTPSEKKDKLEKKASSFVNGGTDGSSSKTSNLMEFDGNGGQIGYGLREKPKKTWKLSDSIDANGALKQEKFCKECGRGFPSWKTLCGHMRCHSSERERVDDSLEEEDDSWIMDSQSDTETAAPRRRQRSSRRTQRYKNTTTVTAASSFSFANASSSITGIEQEQEEVAMCLMMLSRDVGSWGGLNSVSADSEENNSVLVEVRSSITVTKTCNADQIVKKNAKLESKRLELSKSNFGFSPNEFKKSTEVDQTDSECGKWNSSKRTIDEASDSVMGEESWKKVKCNVKDSPRKSKYECTACNKTFHSYQALGGHRASHKRAKGCCGGGSKIESSETSIDNQHSSPDSRIDTKLSVESTPIETEETSYVEASFVPKKNKHECPVCYKVFASGQALGGHKRSHVLEASNQTSIVIQQKLPQIKNLLDLNLPAPEEDNNGRIGFNPWWIGNNLQHQHEQAMGLIFN